jgi:hypothetical protein
MVPLLTQLGTHCTPGRTCKNLIQLLSIRGQSTTNNIQDGRKQWCEEDESATDEKSTKAAYLGMYYQGLEMNREM